MDFHRQQPCSHWSSTDPRNQRPPKPTQECSGTNTRAIPRSHMSNQSQPEHPDKTAESPTNLQRHSESPWTPSRITRARLDDFHREAPTPVWPVQHTSYTGPSQETPNPRNQPPELQTTPNLKQQQA
jgi:hypothetical protein